MRSYQLVLILKSDLSPSSRKKLMEDLKTWLSGLPAGRQGLKITKELEWGVRQLSYEISARGGSSSGRKKQKEGLYLELTIEGESIPQDFEKKLNTSDNVLRHLLLRSN